MHAISFRAAFLFSESQHTCSVGRLPDFALLYVSLKADLAPLDACRGSVLAKVSAKVLQGGNPIQSDLQPRMCPVTPGGKFNG